MNKFLVFVSVLVCASADIGLKIREGSPTGSYLPGVQSGSNSYGAYSNGPQQHYAPGGHSGSYGVGPQGYEGQVSYGAGAPHYGGQATFSSSSYGGAPQYSVQQNFAGVPQAVQYHRSFFFDAPEDLGEKHVRVHVQPSAAAGDKTIYIRAPAYQSKIVPHFNIQQQQQSAGKTKVIVLVKKPEEQQEIIVPAAVQGPAAKPEVVFVKYSNQKEAEQKIQDIQEGASSGDSAKTVFNHRELVSSIKDEPAHHHHGISFGGPGAIIGGGSGIGGSIIGGSGLGGGLIGGPSGVHTSVIGNAGPGILEHHSSGESLGNVSGGEPHYGPAGESGPY